MHAAPCGRLAEGAVWVRFDRKSKLTQHQVARHAPKMGSRNRRFKIEGWAAITSISSNTWSFTLRFGFLNERLAK